MYVNEHIIFFVAMNMVRMWEKINDIEVKRNKRNSNAYVKAKKER